jgi:hypothetical protein
VARNEFDVNGPLELKRVEEVFVRISPVIELVARDKIIGTTPEHPFYVVQRRQFIPAAYLEVGEHFLSDDGQEIELTAVHRTLKTETVYNFRVADHHTYFVGGKGWGFSVWVHNTYGRQLKGTANDGSLMGDALDYRKQIGHASGSESDYMINIAVVRYKTKTGQIRTRAFRSGTQLDDGSWTIAGGGGINHSEQHMTRWLKRNGYSSDDVLSVFTERSPCTQTITNCTDALREFGIRSNRVFYALPHGSTVAQLRDLYKNLL